MNNLNPFSTEDTARLIGRAKRLGYTITVINPEREYLEIVPTERDTFTVPVRYDHVNNEWAADTVSVGVCYLDDIEKITDAYGAAAAMVRELNDNPARGLERHSEPCPW